VEGFAEHGGRLSAARLRFADAPAPWIDLSTGINPHRWPGVVAIALDWGALPDEHRLIELEAAAAIHFGVDPRLVCALPGSEIGLRLLASMGLGDGVHVAPAYRSHGALFAQSVPFAALEPAVADGRSVVLANPNNPDGRVIGAAALADLAERISDRGGWLVVDEAFADGDPAISVAPRVREGLSLVVLRSFGKFFGLAGVRLGFAIGPRAVVEALRDRLGSWPVSTAAQEIGIAAYGDREWIAATRRRLVADAAALDALLTRHGLEARGGCPLFRLVETDDATALFERLARRGILTRPFAYAPRWLRIGLPQDDAAMDRLDAALRDG
jgi:cobalamin biosynthetic protein CobC